MSAWPIHAWTCTMLATLIAWEHPGYRSFMDRLASFARVVAYDKRGTGLSDPVETAPAFDPRLDDLRAVVQTAGCRSPVVFGWSEGSTMAVHIAARIGGLASPSEVLVSRTVRDLVVGSELAFRDTGTHALKGVPDSWQLFALADRQ
jgi:pimeloyl-ACP methyl ester carboxylesterase